MKSAIVCDFIAHNLTINNPSYKYSGKHTRYRKHYLGCQVIEGIEKVQPEYSEATPLAQRQRRNYAYQEATESNYRRSTASRKLELFMQKGGRYFMK